jgi:hypothetical protein
MAVSTKGAPEPEVGMGATFLGRDRSAGTIVSVTHRNGKAFEIAVRPDKAVRTDSNGMSDSQNYSFEPGDPDWMAIPARKNKRGQWQKGMVNPSTKRWNFGYGTIAVGFRDAFYDYSF